MREHDLQEKIMIVDDEAAIADLVEVYLKTEGYDVFKVYSATEALECVRHEELSLAILDVMMPDMDGFTLCRHIREEHFYPIIMLTAKVEDMDKITGLTLGADDYITKPFGVMELISRVRALIRRSMDTGADKSIRVGNIFLDSDRHIVYVDDEPKELTFKEYELLRCLMSNSGVAMHRDRIMELVWGVDFEGEARTLDMHIKTLRQKLGNAGAMIKTVRNVGYVLEP